MVGTFKDESCAIKMRRSCIVRSCMLCVARFLGSTSKQHLPVMAFYIWSGLFSTPGAPRDVDFGAHRNTPLIHNNVKTHIIKVHDSRIDQAWGQTPSSVFGMRREIVADGPTALRLSLPISKNQNHRPKV